MTDTYETLLPRAVKPTTEATRKLAENVAAAEGLSATEESPVSRGLLEIAGSFCKHDYQVSDLRRKIGVGRWFTDAFRRSVGLAPWNFIQDCRMETAARLMRDTNLPIEEVTFLVGYQSVVPLWRLSYRWCGMAPDAFRCRVRGLRHELKALPEAAFAWHFWRRCARGELTSGEAAAVVAHLEVILASGEETV